MKFDYSKKDPSQRVEHVKELIEKAPPDQLTQQYLTDMADYLLFTGESGTTKTERLQEYPIVTKNRDVTVNKRQISYEELVDGSEYGDDIVHALISNDKNQIMDPKDPISDDDLRNIPGMAENAEVIESLKDQMAAATGRRKYLLKKQIISKYQEQYLLKSSWKGGVRQKVTGTAKIHPTVEEKVWIDDYGMPHSDSWLSLLNRDHVAAMLQWCDCICEENAGDMDSDIYLMTLDLKRLLRKALLPDNPMMYDLVKWKNQGYSNEEIVQMAMDIYGVRHSEQWFSTTWKKRIPDMVVAVAQEEYIMRHHNEMGYHRWKVCSRCGKRKLAHPMYFSRSTSADGYYSMCKECKRKGVPPCK